MSECKYCDFKLSEKAEDELGDFLEGASIESINDEGVVANLSKFEFGGSHLNVECNMEWDEHVRYTVADEQGVVDIPIVLDAGYFFGISYCPWCGRKL